MPRRLHSTSNRNPTARAASPASTSTQKWLTRVAPAAVLTLAAGILLWQARDYGLLGWDSYPIIITSRVQSLGDFAGNFTEKLMDGRYSSDFYRPLLNLSFAGDYALWQLEPFGYQLTNVLLFAACAAALYTLARRLAGPRAYVAPWVTMLFFLLHSTNHEIVPVPPRRPEILCGLFMALSLWAQSSPRALALRRPPILPAIFGLLAIASKETGLVLPALSFAAVLLYSPRTGLPQRFRHAFIALVPHVVAVAVMIAARVAVIGGLGGHGNASVVRAFADYPNASVALLRWLIFPQTTMLETRAGLGLLIGVGATLALVALCRLIWRQRVAATAAQRTVLRAGLLGAWWLAIIMLLYSATGLIHQWYLLLPTAGLAIFVGAVADGLVAGLRIKAAPLRTASALALLLLTALLGWQARYSPYVQRYDEWQRASDAGREFLTELRAQLEHAPAGSVVQAPPLPLQVPPRTGSATVYGTSIVRDYSVQAWAELVFPHRRIRVIHPSLDTDNTAAPDETLVLLTRIRKRY
ncbi:MAG: hypothetical protein KKB50_08905 [Planctomycetes bacterium]|nr:hypothetical protein [Planctomycetota bacterium]